MRNEQELYLGGLPTEPDIRRLREKYPDNDLSTEEVIPYQEVAELLKVPVDSFRFKTVTSRWRRTVENESGIIIGTVRGQGFIALDDKSKVSLSGSKLRSAVRAARRSFMVASRVEPKNLSAEERSRLDRLRQRSAKFLCAAQIKGNSTLPNLLEAAGGAE